MKLSTNRYNIRVHSRDDKNMRLEPIVITMNVELVKGISCSRVKVTQIQSAFVNEFFVIKINLI